MTKTRSQGLFNRSWLYFRAGYSTYIALLAGIVFNVLLYGIVVTDNRYLASVFTSLTAFLIPEIILAIAVGVGFGIYRIRRNGAYVAEKEVLYPALALTLKGLVKILEHQPFSDDEKKQFEEAIAKTNQLISTS